MCEYAGVCVTMSVYVCVSVHVSESLCLSFSVPPRTGLPADSALWDDPSTIILSPAGRLSHVIQSGQLAQERSRYRTSICFALCFPLEPKWGEGASRILTG